MVDSAYFQLRKKRLSLQTVTEIPSATMRNVINIAKTEILPSIGLKKKYGDSVEEILAYEEKAQARLEELEGLGYNPIRTNKRWSKCSGSR